jgi:hypothetical protein
VPVSDAVRPSSLSASGYFELEVVVFDRRAVELHGVGLGLVELAGE